MNIRKKTRRRKGTKEEKSGMEGGREGWKGSEGKREGLRLEGNGSRGEEGDQGRKGEGVVCSGYLDTFSASHLPPACNMDLVGRTNTRHTSPPPPPPPPNTTTTTTPSPPIHYT